MHTPAAPKPLSARAQKRRTRPALAPATHSACLLVRMPPALVGMFRFLLEACDNVAAFTVLDRREALLKVFFSPHQHDTVIRTLQQIGEQVPLTVMPWPCRSTPPA